MRTLPDTILISIVHSIVYNITSNNTSKTKLTLSMALNLAILIYYLYVILVNPAGTLYIIYMISKSAPNPRILYLQQIEV